ncbi:ASI1-immunoprecipitated protein 2-like protein [Drosera capensis]
MELDAPSTSEAKCPQGRSSLFYKRGRKSSSLLVGRKNSVEESSSDHMVEPQDSMHDKPEPGFPDDASRSTSVQPFVVENSDNHVQNDLDNLVGMHETSAGGYCLDYGSIDEDQSGESSNAAQQDEKVKHLNEEPLVLSPQTDEDDGPDVEIQDVKVCDICGDAGREDLLAICSRCSDGAEHTYCMREMLDEVPDGDWLCEECKFTEEMEKHKQDPSCLLVDNEKSKILRRSSSSTSDASKLDNTGTLTSRSKITNLISHQDLESKRIGDNTEVSAKKQNIESNIVSSEYRPGRTVISRGNSSKNLDKMKTKQLHVLPSGYHANDSSESVRSPISNSNHGLKGALLKSKSFSTFNSKPKTKFVDDIPQKRKQSVVAKDRLGKMLGKSFSFKGSSSRINLGEAKVKMLSPRSSHVQELNGLKYSKERSFERKNLIKSDNVPASQVLANATKYQSRGEVKKLSASCPVDNGTASFNDPNESDDPKKNLLNSKDGATTLGSSRPGESTDQCTINNTFPGSAVDASKVRTLEEKTNKDNIFKAAIEVAMRKKMDISKRATEKSDGLVDPKIDSGSASRDSLSQNFVVSPKVQGGVSAFSNIQPRNVSVNNRKHLNLNPGDLLPSVKDRDLRELRSRMSAIPEHECVWQGGFEVDRGRRLSGLFDGVQAHVSTCASRKVSALVKKFPDNVVLTEVPRSSTWPAKFQDQEVKEDNIALYFFAKDLKSYERNYKILLEHMIMNDLALRGNIDGIELLVFPSNRLPMACQRWNMLFFLWGVFRGRRPCCSVYKSLSEEKIDSSTLDMVHHDKEGAEPIPKYSQPKVSGKDYSSPSGYHNHVSQEMNSDRSNTKSNCQCSEAHEFSSETQHGGPVFAMAEELPMVVQATVAVEDTIEAENTLGNRRITSDQESVPSLFSKMPRVMMGEAGCIHGSSEIRQDELTKCNVDQLNPGSKMKGGEGCLDALSCNRDEERCQDLMQEDKCSGILNDKDIMTKDEDADKGSIFVLGDFKSEDVSCQQYNKKKRIREDVSMASTCHNSTGVCQEISPNVVIGVLGDASQEGMSKRARQVADSFMVDHVRASTPVREASTGSAMDAKFNETNDEKAAYIASSSDGSCFFIAERIQAADGISSGQVPSSGTGDRMSDGSPNLELGLGSLQMKKKKGDHASFARIVDDEEMAKLSEGEEESTETLSLSLAFPFSVDSTAIMPASNTGRPDDVKTPLNLFKSLPNK